MKKEAADENVIANGKALNGKNPNGKIEELAEASNGRKKSLDEETHEILRTFRDFNFNPNDIKDFISSLRVPEYGAKEVVLHYHKPDKNRKLKIGILSDTHVGHRECQLDYIHSVYDQFKKEKVAAVYHTGDLIEGRMKPKVTHPNERHEHNPEDQVKFLAKNYPDVGINTYYLEGKFPQSFFKELGEEGTNIGAMILEKRPDLIYLSAFEADVRLSPRTTLRLSHSPQATPYAVSYYPQREVASLGGGSKPDILAIGGTHYLYNIPDYRGVAVYLSGTLQRQTPFMRSRKRPANLGAWILEIELYADQKMKDVQNTVIPFY